MTFSVMTGTTAQESWTVTEVDGEVRLHGESADAPPTDVVVKVDGDAFSFDVAVPGSPMKASVAGKVDGDTVTGTLKLAVMQLGTFEGTRSA